MKTRPQDDVTRNILAYSSDVIFDLFQGGVSWAIKEPNVGMKCNTEIFEIYPTINTHLVLRFLRLRLSPCRLFLHLSKNPSPRWSIQSWPKNAILIPIVTVSWCWSLISLQLVRGPDQVGALPSRRRHLHPDVWGRRVLAGCLPDCRRLRGMVKDIFAVKHESCQTKNCKWVWKFR